MLERVTYDMYDRVSSDSPWPGKLLWSTYLDHQARYAFAGENITAPGSDILDAASGSGWGTQYLAKATQAANVVGVDKDPDAIAEALLNVPNELPVKMIQTDLLGNEFKNLVGQFDHIVSFETIEHVPADATPVLLANFRTVIQDGGNLIISTPNRPLFSPYTNIEGKPWYRFHAHEFDREEFVGTLEQNGWRVAELHGQRFVNTQSYSALAKMLYIFRRVGFQLGLPLDHRFMRLPMSLLYRSAALHTDEHVHPVGDSSKQPIFLLAVCDVSTNT